MNIKTNREVTLDVTSVEVRSIQLRKQGAGMVVAAPYQWMDAAGKVVKQGRIRYTEAELGAGLDAGTIATLKSLIPNTNSLAHCHINLGPTITAIRMSRADEKWNGERLDQTQFLAAVAPLTLKQVQEIIVGFTLAAVPQAARGE